jgi:hypothetical protein
MVMNSIRRSTLMLAAVTLVATLVTSLTTVVRADDSNFLAGIHFNAGIPAGGLHDQIDRDAYGLSGQIFFAPSTSPLAIGLEGGWANYGTESRREPFSTTIPDVTVDVETWNNLVQGFAVLRGQVPSGPIQLYADALLGFNYLYTETTIKEHGSGSEDVASSTNQDDTAFAYGFGGGVMVPVWKRAASGKGVQEVSLDGGARYVRGDRAEYLKKGSIHRENGAVAYDMTQSRTDMTRLHFGVTARF